MNAGLSFSVGSKVRGGLLLFSIAAMLFLGSLAYKFWHEGNMADECLDARHGSFNYSTMSCDLSQNHTYIPYQTRYPHDEKNALIALSLFILCSFGYFLTRNAQKHS
jgi:hypothetical protein